MKLVTILFTAWLAGSTIADVETSRRGIAAGGKEANPVFAMFVNNRGAAYSVRGGVDGLALYGWKKSHRSKWWYLLPAFYTAAAISNARQTK